MSYAIIKEAIQESMGAGGIRQTAKAPDDLQILVGFAIYVDEGFDGFTLLDFFFIL